MKTIKIVLIVFSIALSGLSSWLLSEPVYADTIPTLKAVPAGLSNDVRARLTNRRQELEKKRQVFMDVAERFNTKPAEQQSDAEYASLQARRSQYISLVKAFNKEIDLEHQKLEQEIPRFISSVQTGGVPKNAGQPLESAKYHGTIAIKVATWKGEWDKEEKDKVHEALSGFKDGKLKNWIAKNAEFNRDKTFSSIPRPAMGADKSVLNFNDDFFSNDITNADGSRVKNPDARRENLIAFEGGKVFWNHMKDSQRDKLIDLAKRHGSVISQMKAANHENENLKWLADYGDYQSMFAYVFRAKALQLDKPKDKKGKQEWGDVIEEFSRIDSVLQGKQ